MIRRYSYRDSPSYGDGQLRRDPQFVSQNNPRNGAQGGYRPFEERHAIRPFGLPSIPSDFYPATRIIIVSNNTGQGMSPRLLATPSHGLMPRFNGSESMESPTETDASKLTKQEQENVLKKLRKQIYNPMPKTLARRVSVRYRDLNRDPNTKAAEKHDEDGDMKSCAVCLEDFEAREEVMLTPCRHMFHEECIVPWVKNHGQCPVCRASFCERRENDSPFINNSNNGSSSSNSNSRRMVDQPAGQRARIPDDFLSLIHALDEAFPYRM